MMEPFKTSIRIGMITMPQGSRWMCGMGFSVTCPPSEAVSSPPILAARACAASWQVVEKRKTTYQMNPRASCSGEMLGMKSDFVSPASSVDGASQVCKGTFRSWGEEGDRCLVIRGAKADSRQFTAESIEKNPRTG